MRKIVQITFSLALAAMPPLVTAEAADSRPAAPSEIQEALDLALICFDRIDPVLERETSTYGACQPRSAVSARYQRRCRDRFFKAFTLLKSAGLLTREQQADYVRSLYPVMDPPTADDLVQVMESSGPLQSSI
ncbi:MAG: hypothetical protein AB7G93_01405 [Bdellovibrionales bacterium]